jgi:hypothetical protein
MFEENRPWQVLPMGLDPCQREVRGVLTGLKVERFDVGVRRQREFILQHIIWDKLVEKKWCLLNVYGAAQDENKDSFLAEMATFCVNCKDPYIVGGDFNIPRFQTDKNKSCSLNRFSDLFNIIININGLIELDIWGGGGFHLPST